MFISNLLPESIIRTYLDMLCFNNWKKFEPLTLVVSAHPDDEVIGMGSRIPKLSNAVFIYITNGAPDNRYYFTKAGFKDLNSYALARRQELFSALSIAGFNNRDCIFFDIPDQKAVYNIPGIVKKLTDIFASHEPDLVITHPYEGGHPDHDTTALAVHIALQNNLMQNGYAPVALEFTSYHIEGNNIAVNKFLDQGSCIQREVVLAADERSIKQKMINCFASQQDFIKIFPLEKEFFRQIPDYDFTKPPHEGKLYYEQFDWGVNGEKWRELALDALNSFGFLEK